MRIHGVVWYFSAKTLLVAVLLYYSSAPISFCGIWRQRCVLRLGRLHAMDDSVADARYPFGRDRTERPP